MSREPPADRPAPGRPGWLVTDRAVAGLLSILVVLPNLVLAAGLRPLPGGILGLACLAALALLLRAPRDPPNPPERPLRPRRLLACMALAAAILVLGGETHVFYANPDWLVRDAVLGDLARAPLPIGYDIDGESYLLRAPLGMYLVPSLAGRLAGPAAAHGALLAQNSVMLGAIFYMLASLGRGWPHLAILILFGGLSIVWRAAEAVLFDDYARLLRFDRPLDEWNASFQYSASITQFFWVPNHALPGWWLAALLILHARRAVDAATVGVSVAAMLLWSPLAILPAVPALAWFAARDPARAFGSARTWLGLAAAAGFLPVAAYLTAAADTIERSLTTGGENFAIRYAALVAVQLAAALFVAVYWRRLPADLRGLAAIMVLILLALPFFSFGPSNDLVLRGSLAALVILAFCFGEVVLSLARSRARMAAFGVVLVALGAAPAVVEVARALLVPRYAISTCTLMQASRDLGDTGPPANYVARADRVPAWLIDPPARRLPSAEAAPCWPDLERPDAEERPRPKSSGL